jgi:hypothetical protein
LTTRSSTRHVRDMESNNRERFDEIVEEIIDNLRPLKCAVVTAQCTIRTIIERGPPRNFHNRPAAVRQYAKRLQEWIAVGKTLLPKPSPSRVLEVEHIPPEIRVKVLVAAGAKDFLDGFENWPYEQVEDLLATSHEDVQDWPCDANLDPTFMSKVAHEYYNEFFRKIERLAAVAEKGQEYRGPVDPDGGPEPFYAPQFDPIKQGCAEDALELIITLSKKRPSAAPHQNLRTIASLVYEAHCGPPNTDFERACDRARKHWRRRGHTDADPTEPGLVIRFVDADGRIVVSDRSNQSNSSSRPKDEGNYEPS